MSTDEHDRIRGVLFFAGPQWGDRSVDDILKALDDAGYVIVPKDPSPDMIQAAILTFVRENGGIEHAPAMTYRAMISALLTAPAPPAPA